MRVFLKGLGSLAIFVALLFGALEAVAFSARYFGHQIFHGVNPTVAAAIVAAMSTITVAVATLVIGRYVERRKSIESEIRASKIPVYSRLVGGLMRTLLEPNSPNTIEALTELLREVTPDLITWASDDVLIAWAKFRRDLQNLSAEECVFSFEQFLLAIRRDYGHSGNQMKEGDLLTLFINDVEEELTRRRLGSNRI